MATASDTPVRPEIDTVLARLRAKIRRYVFLEGTAWVIVALGAVFWFTLAINWAYFKVSNLELPVWFRVLIDVAAIAFLAGCLMLYLIGRLLKSMRTKALALVLERRFPELDDRLITAVEAAESRGPGETAFTQTLRNRTIAEVSEATRRLEVSDVFAKKPLRNAMLIAVVFVASIVGFGMLNQQAMGYWYKAFFGLQEEYWDRDTLLVPHVVSPADERAKPFRLVDGEYVYKHPRGEDFTLAVVVPTKEESEGKSWVIPGEVEWDYELENDRGGAAVSMSKTGERTFRQTVPNLIDGMTFQIRGNDYINRRPFRVVIVDPPNINRLVLDNNYPDYTGLNPEFIIPGKTPSNIKLVDGSQVSEPMETSISMLAAANKPLVGVKIEGQNFRLTVKREREDAEGESLPAFAKFELLARDGVPILELPLAKDFANSVLAPIDASVEEMMEADQNGDGKLSDGEVIGPLREHFPEADKNEDGILDEEELHGFYSRLFQLPVKLATDASFKLAPPGLPLSGGSSQNALLQPFMQVAETANWLSSPLNEIPLPSNTVLRIFLEDTDDVLSTEPSQLTINGIVDRPPELDVATFGIGEYITPKAQIPIRGKITDDYGVAKARFDYQLKTEAGQLLTGPDWIAKEFENPPETEPKEYVLRYDQGTADPEDDEEFEVFDVTKILFQDASGPRGIKVGDVLELTIYTEDADDINGPHIIRQKPKPEYTFKVVSEDELLDILYQKELGLMSRFQQIITEVEGVRDDLVKAQSEMAELNKLREMNPNVEDEAVFKSITATSQRSIQQAGKNQNETRAVADSFREILEELGNNGIASRNMVESLRRLIIQPMDRITQNDFSNVKGSLESFRAVHAQNQNADEAIGTALGDVNNMLVGLNQVLKELEDLLGWQRLQRNLKEVIEGTEEAKRQADKEAIEQLNKLKLLD